MSYLSHPNLKLTSIERLEDDIEGLRTAHDAQRQTLQEAEQTVRACNQTLKEIAEQLKERQAAIDKLKETEL